MRGLRAPSRQCCQGTVPARISERGSYLRLCGHQSADKLEGQRLRQLAARARNPASREQVEGVLQLPLAVAIA